MSGLIKAVLWDFGGVITSSPFEAFNKFEIKNTTFYKVDPGFTKE